MSKQFLLYHIFCHQLKYFRDHLYQRNAPRRHDILKDYEPCAKLF